jgi:uncharacterized protein YrrD
MGLTEFVQGVESDCAMLRTTGELIRYDAEATDGQIGSVKDLLFDDQSWKIRYLVIDTGSLLCHHKVLVDPRNVRDLKLPEETLVLDLSKRDVESSPGLQSSPPVSQQAGREPCSGETVDPHLRSSNEVGAYKVAASDAEMGQVHGLVVETSTWTVRYLIVDTGEWLMGKLVLLRPHMIHSIDWSYHTMKAHVTSDAIRHCPANDETAELTRDYEAFLHDYYGWPPYWF